MAPTSTFAKIRKLSRLRVGMRCVVCSAASLWLRVRLLACGCVFSLVSRFSRHSICSLRYHEG